MSSYISQLPAQPRAAIYPRSLAVMGSTGSIGINTLKIAALNPETFRMAALAGGRNAALLAAQASAWRPPYLAVIDDTTRKILRKLLPGGYSPQIVCGAEGYRLLASLPEADMVVAAQVGAAGIHATEAAVRSGKMLALANKESLVLAGNLLREAAGRSGAVILPVDSEHNAMFQCLQGQDQRGLRRVVLTASGGPFWGKSREFLDQATPEEALAHPRWTMGVKVTIDSATMMNKGLEVIEAHHLFGLPLDRIDVLVHTQSVVHSLVEFIDGSLLAQAGAPDMRMAISHCLGWPQRMTSGVAPLDLASVQPLTFEKPDVSLFPCLTLALQAQREGRGLPIVLNAANEIAVTRFVNREIPFTAIADIVRDALAAYTGGAPTSFAEVAQLDTETRARLNQYSRNTHGAIHQSF